MRIADHTASLKDCTTGRLAAHAEKQAKLPVLIGLALDNKQNCRARRRNHAAGPTTTTTTTGRTDKDVRDAVTSIGKMMLPLHLKYDTVTKTRKQKDTQTNKM